MKSIPIQTIGKKLLPFAVIFALLLVFLYGFPLAGSDLELASQSAAETGGLTAAGKAAASSGGTYAEAFLSTLLCRSLLLRHVLIAVFLFACIMTAISFCTLERSYTYFLLTAFVITVPKALFADTFAWIQGAVAVLLPALFTLLYVFSVYDLFRFKGKKRAWKIAPLFLYGIAVPFFHEGLGAALILFSAVVFVLFVKKHGFSWHLAAHLFGSVLGMLVCLTVSGSSVGFVGGFYAFLDNIGRATDVLFVGNWILILPLTAVCLMLIQPVRSERSKNCNRTLRLFLIAIALFILLDSLHAVLVPLVSVLRILALVKLLAAGLYLTAVSRVVKHYVSKENTQIRFRLCLLGVAAFFLVFCCQDGPTDNLLFIPYLLVAIMTMLLFTYVMRRYGRLEKVIRKPALILSVVIILAMSWINVSNATVYQLREDYVAEQMKQGSAEVILPGMPYPDYAVEDDLEIMKQYFDEKNIADLNISLVPYAQWQWGDYLKSQSEHFNDEFDDTFEELSEMNELTEIDQKDEWEDME